MKTLIACLLSLLAACPAWAAEPSAKEGVDVGRKSSFTNLVPAADVERSAAMQYDQMKRQAQEQRALAPSDHPQLQRLRTIARKMLPYTVKWNDRAKTWKWEVNLIGSNQINAFCMPGGKIAFFSGLINRLKLSDGEIAIVMGHEIAHALREHARERIGKQTATNVGANLVSQLFGLGNLGNAALSAGVNMLALKYSRDDETEADLIGMELSARAGYDPASGISLWQKMGKTGKGSPPQWLSTHPSGETRIRDIKKHLAEVAPLYDKAKLNKIGRAHV